MNSLGSIFEAADGDGPRGADLRVTVEVPRDRLGHPEGVQVPLAPEIEVGGRMVSRVVAPDEPESITLHLPEGFPSGSVLRLRGQGGSCEEGQPGDLFVQVQCVDPLPAIPWPPRATTLLWTLLMGSALWGLLSWVS